LVEPTLLRDGLPLISNKAPIFPYAYNPIFRTTPDDYVHPVHLVRRYLDSIGGAITDAQFGVGRVQHVDATSKFLDPADLPHPDMPGIIQPIEGSGPSFLERGIVRKVINGIVD